MQILIVEDVSEMRERLIELLSKIPEVQRVRSASGVVDAMREVGLFKPDFVLLDQVLLDGNVESFSLELKERSVEYAYLTSMRAGSTPRCGGRAPILQKPNNRVDEVDFIESVRKLLLDVTARKRC